MRGRKKGKLSETPHQKFIQYLERAHYTSIKDTALYGMVGVKSKIHGMVLTGDKNNILVRLKKHRFSLISRVIYVFRYKKLNFT